MLCSSRNITTLTLIRDIISEIAFHHVPHRTSPALPAPVHTIQPSLQPTHSVTPSHGPLRIIPAGQSEDKEVESNAESRRSTRFRFLQKNNNKNIISRKISPPALSRIARSARTAQVWRRARARRKTWAVRALRP